MKFRVSKIGNLAILKLKIANSERETSNIGKLGTWKIANLKIGNVQIENLKIPSTPQH